MRTEQELKLGLAKLLTDKLSIQKDYISEHCLVTTPDETNVVWKHSKHLVLETEWLHICWLIEQTLDNTSVEDDKYADILKYITVIDETEPWGLQLIRASWQQRAEAILQVKGL